MGLVHILKEIWAARNRLVWEGIPFNVEAIRRTAHAQATAWLQLTRRTNTRRDQPGSAQASSAQSYVDTGSSGFGAVLFNPNGLYEAAISGHLEGIKDPYMAEALAYREALSWIKNKGLTHTKVESDCLMVVQGINSRNPDRF